MSTAHHGHHHTMGLGHHIVEKLLKDPQIRGRIYRGHKINKEFDIPYLGGYSNDGETVYLDRHLPEKVTFHVDGREHGFDPSHFVPHHEIFEKAVMDSLGWSYSAAHEAATAYERRFVVSAGLPWKEYQDSLKPFIKADESEALQSVPPDLDMRPYTEPPVDHSLVARLEKAMGGAGAKKHSKQEVGYSEGSPTSHCGPVAKWPKGACKHFEVPSSCCLVRGFIKNTGWCGLWEQ